MDQPATAYQRLSKFRSELMGIAMLWVMLFHAYQFKFKVPVLDVFKEYGFAGVDIFILLSAMGLYVSLSKKDTSRISYLGPFYYQRAVRVLPTYWLVVGLYSLYLIWRGRIGVSTMLWSLSTLHYWFHIPDSFNWYVPAILAFYLITPWYYKLFQRCSRKAVLTALTIPVSYGLYRLSIPAGLLYTQDFVCRIPAFAFGILIGYYILNGKPFTRTHGAVWGALALCGCAVAYLRSQGYFYTSPCYIIASMLIPGCLLAAKLLDLLPYGWFHRLLRLLGECSLEIYLLNVIVTREFDSLLPFFNYGPRYVVYYVSVYLINFALAIGLHKAIGAIKKRRAAA